MTPWSIPLARWRGRHDAEAGVFLGREFVDERLGPRPAWDPIGRHALFTEAMANTGDLAEYRAIVQEDERRPEREHAFPRGLYLGGAFFLFLVEAEAMIVLLRDLGVGQNSRTTLGLMLAAFAIWITHEAMGERRHTVDGVARLAFRPLAAGVALAGFAVSIAALRLREWGQNGAASLADAVFWIGLGLGPAVLAESLLAQYVRSTVPRNVTHAYGREWKRLEGELRRAWEERERVLREEEAWERAHTRLFAAYTRAYRAREAELKHRNLESKTT
jgi:hypothetical protein